MVKHKTAAQLQNIAPEKKDYILHKVLKKKGIDFYMLEPYMFNKRMYVDCPYINKENKRVSLSCCRRCKKWLGSTTKTKNHWLCLKGKQNENN